MPELLAVERLQQLSQRHADDVFAVGGVDDGVFVVALKVENFVDRDLIGDFAATGANPA